MAQDLNRSAGTTEQSQVLQQAAGRAVLEESRRIHSTSLAAPQPLLPPLAELGLGAEYVARHDQSTPASGVGAIPGRRLRGSNFAGSRLPDLRLRPLGFGSVGSLRAPYRRGARRRGALPWAGVIRRARLRSRSGPRRRGGKRRRNSFCNARRLGASPRRLVRRRLDRLGGLALRTRRAAAPPQRLRRLRPRSRRRGGLHQAR